MCFLVRTVRECEMCHAQDASMCALCALWVCVCVEVLKIIIMYLRSATMPSARCWHMLIAFCLIYFSYDFCESGWLGLRQFGGERKIKLCSVDNRMHGTHFMEFSTFNFSYSFWRNKGVLSFFPSNIFSMDFRVLFALLCTATRST